MEGRGGVPVVGDNVLQAKAKIWLRNVEMSVDDRGWEAVDFDERLEDASREVEEGRTANFSAQVVGLGEGLQGDVRRWEPGSRTGPTTGEYMLGRTTTAGCSDGCHRVVGAGVEMGHACGCGASLGRSLTAACVPRPDL